MRFSILFGALLVSSAITNINYELGEGLFLIVLLIISLYADFIEWYLNIMQ